MRYALRITDEHPSGPYVRVVDGDKIIFCGRIVKTRIAEFVVWFFTMQRASLNPDCDDIHSSPPEGR